MLLLSKKSLTDLVHKTITYLARTEHERWYNERRMQGCLLSKQQSHIFNQNSKLKHWDALNSKQKHANEKYVIQSLIARCKQNKTYINKRKKVIKCYY